MLDIRLFRFETGLDVLSFYKPYFYENYDFKSVRELLLDIAQNDPYFQFSNVKFVKINEYLVNLDENFAEIVSKFGENLTIAPLCEKRAKKDLIIDNSDFLESFKNYVGFEGAKSEYLRTEALFYLDYDAVQNSKFLGLNFFVFAKFLADNNPELEQNILAKVATQLPYFEPPKIFRDEFGLFSAIEFFNQMLNIKNDEKKFMYFSDDFRENETKFRLDNFRVCLYRASEFENVLQNLGAKIVKFDAFNKSCGQKLFGFDDEYALKLASDVLFSAYDAGCDFLVVNDKKAFEILDGKSDEIMRFYGRDLENFFIVSTSELFELLCGKKVESFKNHNLKVRF